MFQDPTVSEMEIRSLTHCWYMIFHSQTTGLIWLVCLWYGYWVWYKFYQCVSLEYWLTSDSVVTHQAENPICRHLVSACFSPPMNWSGQHSIVNLERRRQTRLNLYTKCSKQLCVIGKQMKFNTMLSRNDANWDRMNDEYLRYAKQETHSIWDIIMYQCTLQVSAQIRTLCLLHAARQPRSICPSRKPTA